MTMKKLLLALIAGLALSHAIMAQGSTIGIVDADVVIQKSAKGIKFFEDYKAFAKGLSDEIEGMIATYREKEKDYNAKSASLSEDKSRELLLDLQKLQTEIKRKQEDAKAASDNMLNAGLERFRKELAPLIRQVAQEKNLDLVLNYGPNSNLVYFSDNVNITPDVIKKYDETAN